MNVVNSSYVLPLCIRFVFNGKGGLGKLWPVHILEINEIKRWILQEFNISKQ